MTRPALHVIEGGRQAGRAWLKELYSKFGGAVYGRCRFLLKDPSAAEDAMQDVFAKALTHEETFRAQASPLTWLITIATNHCFNVMRAGKASWHQQYQDVQVVTGEGHGGPSEYEARDLLRRALAKFDVETQQAVVHYYVDDMTLEEVAAALERSVPTIRKRIKAFADETGRTMREELS